MNGKSFKEIKRGAAKLGIGGKKNPTEEEVAEARKKLRIERTEQGGGDEVQATCWDLVLARDVEGESTLDIAQKRRMPLRTVQHELRQASLEIQKALARPKVVALRQSGSGVS